MKKEEQLLLVDADLARGHTHPALQRLANLTALHSDDLEIRAKLAAVNRQIGNVAEAGRWGFLAEDASPAEVTAFERAYPRPAERFQALRLQRDPGSLLGPLARARFRDLELRAQQAGEPGLPGPASRLENLFPILGCAVVGLIVLAVLGLAVVGFVSLVR